MLMNFHVAKLSSHTSYSKKLGGSSIYQVNNIYRTHGFHNRTGGCKFFNCEYCSCFCLCFTIFSSDAEILCIFIYNSAVYQSNCSELSTPFEGEPFICHRESFDAFSSKFIRVALHVLLLFSPLVHLQLLFLGNIVFFLFCSVK